MCSFNSVPLMMHIAKVKLTMKKATQCALVGAAIFFHAGCGEWSSIEPTEDKSTLNSCGLARIGIT